MIHHSSILDGYVRDEVALKQREIDQNIHTFDLNKVKHNTPVVDFIIRWSSTFKMLNRFIKMRSIINDITHTPENIDGLKPGQRLKLCRLAFSHSYWNWLISLEYVLRPFEQCTRLLSGRSYPTIAIAKIVMNGLERFLTTNTLDNTMTNILKIQLLEKFKEYCEQRFSDDSQEAMVVREHLILYSSQLVVTLSFLYYTFPIHYGVSSFHFDPFISFSRVPFLRF